MPKKLQKTNHWVFDLDNTLYPYHCNLFAQVDAKMREFIAKKLQISDEEAKILQKKLFHYHGTTLNGLKQHYEINEDEYLKFTHDIDYTVLKRDDRLAQLLESLEGNKFIFTNGPDHHAQKTLKQLGIEDIFEGIFDIHIANYHPKPEPKIYDAMLEHFKIKDAKEAVMIDDLAWNLVPAWKLGMKTVLITGNDIVMAEEVDGKYIDFESDNLSDFLELVLGKKEAAT